MLNRATVATIALVLMAVLAACGGSTEAVELPYVEDDAAPTANPAPLDGTEWVLTTLNGSSLVKGSNITLTFSEGSATGFAGCNGYGGRYTAADESTLTIPEIAITLQLCQSPDGVMEQEDTYVGALSNAVTYRVMDDRLEIGNAAGEMTLVFDLKEEFPMDPGDLVGTRWQLLSLNGNSPIDGSTITIAFSEGVINGYAGCRGYTGSYEATGDDIRFPMLTMTGYICIEPEALILQEGEYTTNLQWATNYRLSEGQLEIFTARGEVLVYGPAPGEADTGQEKTIWALDTFIEGSMATSILAETEITVTFEDGKVSGSAGCNTYTAAYTFDGSFFTFETPAVTAIACNKPAGVMEQEQRYLGFLEGVTVYRIAGSQITLSTEDGRALVYQANVPGHVPRR